MFLVLKFLRGRLCYFKSTLRTAAQSEQMNTTGGEDWTSLQSIRISPFGDVLCKPLVGRQGNRPERRGEESESLALENNEPVTYRRQRGYHRWFGLPVPNVNGCQYVHGSLDSQHKEDKHEPEERDRGTLRDSLFLYDLFQTHHTGDTGRRSLRYPQAWQEERGDVAWRRRTDDVSPPRVRTTVYLHGTSTTNPGTSRNHERASMKSWRLIHDEPMPTDSLVTVLPDANSQGRSKGR